jgi:hypothetical protein
MENGKRSVSGYSNSEYILVYDLEMLFRAGRKYEIFEYEIKV